MDLQIKHYENKLAFEMDPSDLFDALNNGEMNEESTKHLDKECVYVTYCDGIGCNASTKGALNMSKLGFKVKELMGGIEWWKFDGYATEGTKASQMGAKIQCAC